MYNIGDIVQKRYLCMGKRMRKFLLVLENIDGHFYSVMDLSDGGDICNHWLEEKSEIYVTKKVG